MNKLCCELNPLYYCGECDRRECKVCWIAGGRNVHFKFFYEHGVYVKCNETSKILTSKTFFYYDN